MKAPKCRLCGVLHWSHEPHQFASNEEGSASNTVHASNKKGKADKNTAKANEVEIPNELPVATPLSAPVPKQRWDRAAYNTYQREYMKKRRAAKVQPL